MNGKNISWNTSCSRNVPIFNRILFFISTKNSWFTTLYISMQNSFWNLQIFHCVLDPLHQAILFNWVIQSSLMKRDFSPKSDVNFKEKSSIIYSPDPTTNSETMTYKFDKNYTLFLKNHHLWILLKVGKFQKQILLLSFEPKIFTNQSYILCLFFLFGQNLSENSDSYFWNWSLDTFFI